MTFRHHILSLFALMILIGVATSCSKDSFGGPEDTTPAPRPTMGITISLAGASSTRADNDPAISGDYEIGEGYENYLDIARGNYRIYFFETDENGGTYIDTFRPFIRPTQNGVENVPVTGKPGEVVPTFYYWQFLGEVPHSLPLQFKLVVLANWPEYPEEAAKDEAGNYEAGIGSGSDSEQFKLVPGKTTIAGLCQRAETQFNRLATPAPNGAWLDESRLIPFYGVREYDLNDYVAASDIKDGKIDGDIYIDLSKTKNDNKEVATALPLLRAMAKVEVILNNPLASFSAVTIDRVNAKGFCAPANATKHDDYDNGYDHGYNWDLDFIRGVHLTNNDQNDAAPTSIALTKIASRTEADGKVTPERWVAYIPEYKNIGADVDFCSITVTLANPDSNSFRDPGEAPKDENNNRPVWEPTKQTNTIYFATNGTEASNNNNAQASATTPGRYNIERNNIYRFTITGMNANLSCELDIQPYADCPLTVDFGLMRDERGDLMVIPDDNDKLPPYFEDYMAKHADQWPKDENTSKPIELLEGDYYAMVRQSDTATSSGANFEVWVKDSDGCRVMTNLSQRQDDDPDCSTRKVRDYSEPPLEDYKEYQKDQDGHQRLQHNLDHSSVVLNHEKQMLFKTNPNVADDNTYLVESWDEASGIFWYLKEISQPYPATDQSIKEALGIDLTGTIPDEYSALIKDNATVRTYVFYEANISGKDTGKTFKIIEKISNEENKNL